MISHLKIAGLPAAIMIGLESTQLRKGSPAGVRRREGKAR
jgi:hypothetical protein